MSVKDGHDSCLVTRESLLSQKELIIVILVSRLILKKNDSEKKLFAYRSQNETLSRQKQKELEQKRKELEKKWEEEKKRIEEEKKKEGKDCFS